MPGDTVTDRELLKIVQAARLPADVAVRLKRMLEAAGSGGGGSGDVESSRLISTTAPLTGGGDLSADRTLAVSTFTSGASGVVPASGGSTLNFLRADGTWTAPPAGSGLTPTTTNEDSFNRANSTTSLGDTDGSSSGDPATWTQHRGTWGIISNTAYVSAVAGGAQFNSATIGIGQANNWAQATITTRPTLNGTGIGLVIGHLDLNNFYYAQCNRSGGGAFSYVIGKYIGSTASTLIGAAGVAPADGDVLLFQRTNDAIFRLYVNGSVVASAYDGAFPTATRAGLLDITSSGTPNGGRLDAFSAGYFS